MVHMQDSLSVLLRVSLLLVSMLTFPALASGQYEVSINDRAASHGQPVILFASLDNSVGSAVKGWSWGICHDPGALELLSVTEGGSIQGKIPDFYSIDIYPGGWTVDATYEFPDAYLVPHVYYSLSKITYQVLGTEVGETTEVNFCGTLGDPAVAVTITEGVGQTIVVPLQNNAVVTMNPIFKRGDCNNDGVVNLADSIFLLLGLFAAGPAPPCEDACDLDDDGGINIGDGVYGLSYLFADGLEPPLPGPYECGQDLPGNADGYDCTYPPEC